MVRTRFAESLRSSQGCEPANRGSGKLLALENGETLESKSVAQSADAMETEEKAGCNRI